MIKIFFILFLATIHCLCSDPRFINLKNITNVYKNYCVGNKTLQSDKEKLQAFVEGPCSPILVLPGVGASKLQLTFSNCTLFMQKYPSIYRACGWTICDQSFWFFYPKNEYEIWLPKIFSPMSLLLFTNDTAVCFGFLGSMIYNITEKDPTYSATNLDGINITWMGNTPNTKKSSQCGLGAVGDLLPSPIQDGWTRGFKPMADFFQNAGYINGITMQFLPYDYRMPLQMNDVRKNFLRCLEYLYKLTGKKVVIASHSFGNMNTLYNLYQISYEDKNRLVQHWVSAAPPFAGVTKGLLPTLGGDNEFYFGLTGMNYKSAYYFLGSMFSRYICSSRNLYNKNKNETWMEVILSRIQLENEYPPNTPEGEAFWKTIPQNDSVVQIFPNPLEICSPNYKDRIPNCIIGIVDLINDPIFEIEEKEYYSSMESVQELFEDWSFNSEYDVPLTYFGQEDGINDLTNPEVPVSLFFGNMINTTLKFTYNSNPKENMEEWRYYNPDDITYSLGDGTVNTFSSLVGGIKWSWDFEYNNEEEKYKPTTIVEYCSIYQQAFSPYDSVNEEGINYVKNNKYIGAGCECTSEDGSVESANLCTHASIVTDPYFYFYVFETANTNHHVDFNTTEGYSLSNEQLESLYENCPQLVDGWNITADQIFNNLNFFE